MKKWLNRFFERIASGGYTHEEMSIAAGGGGKGGSEAREPSEQEKDLWAAQEVNLTQLTEIAGAQFDLSEEDRKYYENVFRDGTDTEAKDAIAKLRSQITGEYVDPDSIQSSSIDTLLRDTILTATPEFQEAAAKVIQQNDILTQNYGEDVTGISTAFADGLKQLTKNYSDDLQLAKDKMGTADADMLSREVGAATAGVSSSYQEANKQLTADLARRGLSGSGVEGSVIADMYQQEAMAKAGAAYQGRMSAIGLSDQRRMQQVGIAGQQFNAEAAANQGIYQSGLGATQNIYGVTTQNNLQGYQMSQAATLQGIAGLTQLAQAGQGIYAGSANYLAGAAGTTGTAASIAGQSAVGIGGLDNQYTIAQQQADASSSAGFGSLVGTLGSAAILASDRRLKTNIKKIGEINGFEWYSWDWIEGHNYGYNEGVMAQDVLEIKPDAVVMMDNGYMAVNYAKLGV